MLSGRAARMVTYLYHSLFKDIELWNNISLKKSEETFFRRLEKEGFHFATSLLPTLGKALDQVLAGGLWERPAMFKAKSADDMRPALFFELFSLVLDSDGKELKEPSVTAVKDIRQIAGLFYKYELPFDEDTVYRAWSDLKTTDASLVKPKLVGDITKVIDLARILLNELLCDLDPRSGIPGHGPGATTENLDNWEKSLFEEIPTVKVSAYFGWQYFFANSNDIIRSMSKYGKRSMHKSQVKPESVFCCVPKDSRGPRTICKEATTTQYVQQSIKNILYKHIESHPLTAGFVNFTDQAINGILALWGSNVERDIVTLDMKDASMRITFWLVELLFSDNWVEALDATRSEYIRHGSEVYGPVNMYAPMGSALCFPIESLVHWSLAVASITLVYGLDLDHVLKSVYVYGDDIVLRGVPYSALFPIFERLGMRFNEGKCCTGGRFRESCGTDAYRGELVSPIRIKKPILSSGSPELLVASTAYANAAYNEGLHHFAASLQNCTEEIWHTRLPYTTEDSDVIGWSGKRGNSSPRYQPLDTLAYLRYDQRYHRLEWRGLRASGKKYKGLTDWCRYRDTIRTFASRQVEGPLDFLFPGPTRLLGKIDRPTYRHALRVDKTYTNTIVSY